MEMFHHDISQLLFMSAISHRDINTAAFLLKTIVKVPDEDYWVYFNRVMKF